MSCLCLSVYLSVWGLSV